MIKLSFSLFTALFIFSCSAQMTDSDQLVQRSSNSDSTSIGLDSTDINYQFRGYCTAFNSQKNNVKSNGEAHSPNLAKKIDESFQKNGHYLFLNTAEYESTGNNLASHKLYLVNSSNSKTTYAAQDSRLYIVAQAKDSEGNWKNISYLASSWCGNSYHTLTLGKNEYWNFSVPVFKGTLETKLRYVLTERGEELLVSNEIDVRLNPDQFDPEKKQGYSPRGLMDPYPEE